MAYQSLASSYDSLTEDVDYAEMHCFLRKILKDRCKSPESLLDLGCGTASVSLLFADEGCEVTALDLSEDMLAEASRKAMALPPSKRPRFLCCPMQDFELPYGVDCIISSLDSMNYLTDPEDLRVCLRRSFSSLNPGGVIAFDLITPFRFASLDGQIFLDEREDVFCVWRADFDPDSRLMTYGMDLFQKTGQLWKRSGEWHEEYAYQPGEVGKWLEEIGFVRVSVYGNGTLASPSPEETRVWIVAEKE